MQVIKKSDCKFNRGIITNPNNDIVCLPYEVQSELEALDDIWQMEEYLSEQEAFHPAPTIVGFHRETYDDYHAWKMPEAPKTPVLDRRVKETLAFLGEQEKVEKHDRLATLVGIFKELLDFCAEDEFPARLSCDYSRIKCAAIDNPLELTVDRVMDILKALADSDYVEVDTSSVHITDGC